jgi:hypothetical protein
MAHRCGTQVEIETIPQYSEFNEPSPKNCPKNILMGMGQGGGETHSCLRISLLIFYITEGFQQSGFLDMFQG